MGGFLSKFAGGFAKGAADVMEFQMKSDMAEKAAIRADERRLQLEQRRDEMARARNREVTQRATEFANKDLNANLDQAQQAYADWQRRDPEGAAKMGVDKGFAAVDEARRNQQAPSAADLVRAGTELGTVSPTEAAEFQTKREDKEYQRSQDTLANARADKQLQLSARQVEIAAATAARSAAATARGEADKAALKAEYENYAVLLQKDAEAPGSANAELAKSATRIAALGGNPQTLTDLLFGKKSTQEVTDKTVNVETGGETSTKRTVQGERQGGILNRKPTETEPDYVLENGKVVPNLRKRVGQIPG